MESAPGSVHLCTALVLLSLQKSPLSFCCRNSLRFDPSPLAFGTARVTLVLLGKLHWLCCWPCKHLPPTSLSAAEILWDILLASVPCCFLRPNGNNGGLGHLLSSLIELDSGVLLGRDSRSYAANLVPLSQTPSPQTTEYILRDLP